AHASATRGVARCSPPLSPAQPAALHALDAVHASATRGIARCLPPLSPAQPVALRYARRHSRLRQLRHRAALAAEPAGITCTTTCSLLMGTPSRHSMRPQTAHA